MAAGMESLQSVARVSNYLVFAVRYVDRLIIHVFHRDCMSSPCSSTVWQSESWWVHPMVESLLQLWPWICDVRLSLQKVLEWWQLVWKGSNLSSQKVLLNHQVKPRIYDEHWLIQLGLAHNHYNNSADFIASTVCIYIFFYLSSIALIIIGDLKDKQECSHD